jgi:hypothetical protein
VKARLIAIITLWLACAGVSWAQPAVDAVTSTTVGVVTSASFAHTATGSNRLAIVCIGYVDPSQAVISTVTYGGAAMTLIGSPPAGLAMYRLVAPATGSQTVVVGWDAFTSNGKLGVITYTNVDQTTPLGTFASASGASSTAEVNVSSATGELVNDCMFALAGTITIGAGQTSRWEQEASGVGVGSSTEAGAPTVTMSWSLSAVEDWNIGGVSIKPVSTAPADFFRRRF